MSEPERRPTDDPQTAFEDQGPFTLPKAPPVSTPQREEGRMGHPEASDTGVEGFRVLVGLGAVGLVTVLLIGLLVGLNFFF